MLDEYMRTRDDGANFWDLDRSHFGSGPLDADLIARFAERRSQLVVPKAPLAVLSMLAGADRWGPSDIEAISALTANDFYNIFKQNEGPGLQSLVNGALCFRRITNPTPEMASITANATEALRLIASETPLNAKRIQRYGVNIQMTEH
jgi:hypothetical protein